jgi:threonine/homoserine/homoserine lactone efflux protein
LMVALVGLGLAGPLAASSTLHAALRWIGGAWMLWIAWSIARAEPAMTSRGGPAKAPMGFGAAALFQWVNPKAWVIAIVASTTYTVPGHGLVA